MLSKFTTVHVFFARFSFLCCIFRTAEYETPLQLAIHCRLSEVVDALCVRGVDMSAPDRLGNCALWAALDSGQDDIASILVRHGADTDCWGEGPEGCRQTLLHRSNF